MGTAFLEKASKLQAEYDRTKDSAALWKKGYYYLLARIKKGKLLDFFSGLKEAVKENEKKKLPQDIYDFIYEGTNDRARDSICRILVSENIERIVEETVNSNEASKPQKTEEKIKGYLKENEPKLKKKYTFLNVKTSTELILPYVCAYPETLLDAIRASK